MLCCLCSQQEQHHNALNECFKVSVSSEQSASTLLIYMVYTVTVSIKCGLFASKIIELRCVCKRLLNIKNLIISYLYIIRYADTGCFYRLSPINLVWGPLKYSKSNFNLVHVFLHFKSFCMVVLKLILASKLSEL